MSPVALMNSIPLSLIFGRIVAGILVVVIIVLLALAIREGKAREVLKAKIEPSDDSSSSRTEFYVLAAIIPWPLFAAVPLAPYSWLAGIGFALFGACIGLFGRGETGGNKSPAASFCTWSCCGAILLAGLLYFGA